MTTRSRTAARALAALVVRARWFVVGAWAVAAVVATLTLPALEESGGDLGSIAPRDAPAVAAQAGSFRAFGIPLLTRAAVVQRDPSGLDAATLAASVRLAARVSTQNEEGFREVVAAVPVVNDELLAPAAGERDTAILTYLYFVPEASAGLRTTLAERYATRLGGDAHVVGVTGSIPARIATRDQIRASLPAVTLGTAVLVALVVGLAFRSVGAPVLALLAVGAAYMVDIRVVAWAGASAGLPAPPELEPIIVVLLFGIVTDYVIFAVSGARGPVRAGAHGRAAALRSLRQVAPVIVTAGATVAVGTAALLAGELEFFRSFGPGLAITAIVGTLAALTLVPALIAIGGRLLLWPSHGRRAAPPVPVGTGPERERIGERLASVLARRRSAAVVASLAVLVLVAAASGLARTDLAFSLFEGLPPDDRTRQATTAAGEAFVPGIVAPTLVLVQAPGLREDPEALARLERRLERWPEVAAVLGPSDRPSPALRGLVVSRSTDAARYLLFLGRPPLDAASIASVQRLRDRLPGLLDAAGLAGASAQVGGDTALVGETVAGLRADFRRVGAVALAGLLLILVVFLRSMVAPLYLLASSALAVAATFGLVTHLMPLLGMDTTLDYVVPFAGALLLVSLGSDYNVFLAGRVWAAARTRPLPEALRQALPESSHAISAAALVLSASFALLSLVPLESFREFALVMSLGVLIDAFVVRSLLVPALITLVGRERRHPAARVGTGLAAPPPRIGLPPAPAATPALGAPAGIDTIRVTALILAVPVWTVGALVALAAVRRGRRTASALVARARGR